MDIHAQKKRIYLFLIILTVASAMGLQGWRTLINNFAVEAAGLDGLGMGVVQSVREIPGFLALLVVYLLLIIREHRLAALSVLIMGLGVAGTGLFPSVWGLALTTLVMSFGFHYFETCNQSLTLQHFDSATAPIVFGRLRGMMSVGNLIMGGAIFILAPVLEYTQLFALVGVAVAVAGASMLWFEPRGGQTEPQRKTMVLRWKYWLYYLLTFLAGARRQIFVAFSVFLLVERFGFSVREVTALFVLNNAINWFAGPWIGRAVVRLGERRVLSVEYAGLVLVFMVYAQTGSKAVVALMYVLDHLLFNCAFAIRTYFQKIAKPADIAPSMAVGFTINHIAAVVVPVTGGLLWLVDPAMVFYAGAGLALVSLVCVQLIRTPAAS
ncbi:MFS transporter [Desulfovibrio ferrophilus]|uniref:Major facilitator superfamily protein n=1 Tax=Desulfovibrio ferrophilus TaxID=241368 RepID=A0A2Z6B0S7_9BACT|nr:MFS transporter [Desulfovibrio ferrophilus]BBD09063.1 major facilitator superfamily protein [Desulfovibrio ferrophilus]